MEIDTTVLKQVSDELQEYVYMLVDPDSGVPFYVGKGTPSALRRPQDRDADFHGRGAQAL